MNERKLLWCDLETTGLDYATCKILSVGFIVTDGELNELATFEEDVQCDENPWSWGQVVREMHTKSGLIERVNNAPFKFNEVRTLARAFVLKNAGPKPVLAGSSVHFDHRFLLYHAPEIPALCHYRMLDVSVFKVLGEMWELKDWENPLGGTSRHTPLADIRDSIAALKWYRQHLVFVSGQSATTWVRPATAAEMSTT